MTTTEQTQTPTTGLCDSCGDLALLSAYNDEDGQTWSVCPACA